MNVFQFLCGASPLSHVSDINKTGDFSDISLAFVS